MPTEDFGSYRDRFQTELERLDEAPIADQDRAAIRKYLRDKDGQLEPSSKQQYCSVLRKAAGFADLPLVEMALDDLRALEFDLRNNPEYGRGDDPMSDYTVYNYLTVLQGFYLHRDAEWAEDLNIEKPDRTVVDENDMLQQEDIAALVDAAPRPRDIAMIEFLADTGARLSLMGSLRVKDVSLDDETATYTPNKEALGLKGAEIKPYPIIDAKASLRVYLRHSHPAADDPDAALFHRFDRFGDRYDDDGALSPSQVRERFLKIADEAGIEKPVNPHNFRHSAISRMWREGYSKQQIQHRVHWSLDTNMWKKYVHVTAEEMNAEIFAEAGVADDGESMEIQRHPCGNCRETLPGHAEYCPNCGEPAIPEARGEVAALEDDGLDDLSDGDLAPHERRLVRAFVAELRSDKTMAADTHVPSSPQRD